MEKSINELLDALEQQVLIVTGQVRLERAFAGDGRHRLLAIEDGLGEAMQKVRVLKARISASNDQVVIQEPAAQVAAGKEGRDG